MERSLLTLDFVYDPGPCVRSGMCCKTSACAFGEWDKEAKQCRFLEISSTHKSCVIYACGKKAEIEALPPEYMADINPAFGEGCCMTLFNANRRKIIQRAEKLGEHSQTD